MSLSFDAYVLVVDCMGQYEGTVVCSQIMSLEDVEKIMDETREAVEYQRVRS